MTTALSAGTVPVLDLTDRMVIALRKAPDGGMTALEMAAYLDVSRASVANWLHGKIVPSTQTLRLWAMRTGVPFEWLRTGADGTMWAPRDSNPQPTVSGPTDDLAIVISFRPSHTAAGILLPAA